MYSFDPRTQFGHYPQTTFGGTEFYTLFARIEEMRSQIAQLNEIVRSTRTEASPIRFRESDTYLYSDFYLPFLNIGDIEVAVSGNRIIFHTLIPVAPMNRWFAQGTQLPRGFEFFELPDGRVEFSWLVPVPFVAKEVEATFREGYLSICLPKSEVTVLRQPVKISAKETRRAATGMNS